VVAVIAVWHLQKRGEKRSVMLICEQVSFAVYHAMTAFCGIAVWQMIKKPARRQVNMLFFAICFGLDVVFS
jgi:hypothetical protein